MPKRYTRFGTIILTAAAAAAVLGACSKPATVDNGADPAPSSSSAVPAPSDSSSGLPGRGNGDPGEPPTPDGTTFVALTRSDQNLPKGAPNGPGTVVITADGSWAFTPESGAAKSGKLTAAQLSTLTGLVAGTSIATTTDSSTCPPDTPTYTLTLPGKEVTGTCGKKRNDVFTEVVDLILAATAI